MGIVLIKVCILTCTNKSDGGEVNVMNMLNRPTMGRMWWFWRRKNQILIAFHIFFLCYAYKDFFIFMRLIVSGKVQHKFSMGCEMCILDILHSYIYTFVVEPKLLSSIWTTLCYAYTSENIKYKFIKMQKGLAPTFHWIELFFWKVHTCEI